MATLLSVEEAAAIVLDHGYSPFVEEVTLENASGRVLGAEVRTDSDLPPFDRVMMDGIAVRWEDLGERRSLTISGIQRAGDPPGQLTGSGSCMEVMTGAVLPAGCDTVIPYEHIHIEGGQATLQSALPQRGANIHVRGHDRLTGDVLLHKGQRIGPTEIGILASAGIIRPQVLTLPKVTIISTGNELVDPGETPLPHQIRRSNVFALRAMLAAHGVPATLEHCADEAVGLTQVITHALDCSDLVLLSGGVSKGKFDLVPEILSATGVKVHFHGVAQKPGKPMWFGSRGNTIVFGFPGNPVSTLACAARYLLPWLRLPMGAGNGMRQVHVHQPPAFRNSLTNWIPAQLRTEGGRTAAHLLRNHGSGDFSALAGADGFVEFPVSGDAPPDGIFDFYPLT